MEKQIPISGISGTRGVRNLLSSSGRLFRNTIIDVHIRINADKVPMLTSSATSAIGVKPETSAVTKPMISVGR